MALVIETGSGLANATSWVTAAEYVAWVRARYGSDVELGGTSDQEPALVRAADYLRHEGRLRYRGLKATAQQSMPFPRRELTDKDGNGIAATVIPFQVKEAQCYLAYAGQVLGADLSEPLARGGQIASKTIGPISTSYFQNANPETLYPFVCGILAQLLYDDPAAVRRALPYAVQPSSPVGFRPGDFWQGNATRTVYEADA